MAQPIPIPIPGPPGLPVVGNVYDLDLVNTMESLNLLADTYGEVNPLLPPKDCLLTSQARYSS
jgi:hypothetical protein